MPTPRRSWPPFTCFAIALGSVAAGLRDLCFKFQIDFVLKGVRFNLGLHGVVWGGNGSPFTYYGELSFPNLVGSQLHTDAALRLFAFIKLKRP